MKYCLNVVYVGLLFLLTPWLCWAAWRNGKYREGWAQKLWGAAPALPAVPNRIWFHAVSVGEINVLATLTQDWQTRFPEVDWVVSTTTKTGYDLARQRFPGRHVFYCPLDFSWAVARALRRIRPTSLILTELELWPNLISQARRQQVRVGLINGRMSDKSFRGYSRLKPLLRPLLQSLDLVAVQTSQYAERFLKLGVRRECLTVSGSIKFDGVEGQRGNPRTDQFRRLMRRERDEFVFLAGSTQAPEEQMVIDVFRELVMEHSDLRLVLVPRHPERFDEVASLLQRSALTWIRRSQLDSFEGSDSPTVVLVDTVGELQHWWGVADAGYVGGSMGSRGGQNMIEPAAYGMPVCFGPHTSNFRDVVALMLQKEAAFVVENELELKDFVSGCLAEPEWRENAGARARDLVISQQGARQRTLERLQDELQLPARRAA